MNDHMDLNYEVQAMLHSSARTTMVILNYEVQAMLHSSAGATMVILKFFVMLGLAFLVVLV